MGVDVNLANVQAAQLRQYADSLKNAKKNMQSYKMEISGNWIGMETTYIHSGIDKVILQLDSVIAQLDSIQNDIVITASQIRQEEIAREEAEKQARLAAAAEDVRIAAEQVATQSATQIVALPSSTQQTVSRISNSQPNSSSSHTNTQKQNSFLGWFSSWF